MGKLGRGTLWVMLPGVAWLKSRRERDRRERELLAALQRRDEPAMPAAVNEIGRRQAEIDTRLEAAGFVTKLTKAGARKQLAHLTIGEGMTVDEALDRIAPLET